MFEDPPTPVPSNGTKSARSSDSDVQLSENMDTRASKQPVFQVINTMDDSSTDAPSISGEIYFFSNAFKYKKYLHLTTKSFADYYLYIYDKLFSLL